MIDRHTKFEDLQGCNEDMKDKAKICLKNLVLSHPLEDLEVTHNVHLWIDGKRIVDFLLVIIERFSLAVTAEALLREICRNRRFLNGWVTFDRKFMGTSPAIRL